MNKKSKVKVAVMEAPGKISIKYFPYPQVSEDTAIVKMEASGICGSDKHMYKGETRHGLGSKNGTETSFPIIPGHENVVRIVEIGKKAAKSMEINGDILKEGDRIFPVNDVLCGECYWCKNIYGFPFCENWRGYGVTISCKEPPHLFGGWAEFMFLDSKVRIAKIPEEIPTEVAVLIEPMAVAYSAISKASGPYPIAKEGFGPGDSVVIQGAGPLGICNAVMARIFGASNIIAVENGGYQSEYRLRIARELGVNHIVNDEDPKERVREVLEITENRGADLVIECAGVPSAIPEGLEMIRRGGTLVELSNYIDMGEAHIQPNRHLVVKQARIIGVSGWTWQSCCKVIMLMKSHSNTIPFKKIVTHKFNIEKAEDGIKTSLEKKALKVIITPGT